MSEPMNSQKCDAVREQFALLLYGELNFDEEERVESHLDGCAECRQALARQKRLHEALDGVAVTPSPALLSRSRQDLSALLDQEKRPSGVSTWWQDIKHSFSTGWKVQFLRPAGAVALLAIGFLGAKLTPGMNFGNAFQAMSLGGFGGAQVRDVATQPDGTVRIVLNETRQREVSGNMEDQHIRDLLLSAAKEASDPGLRAQTVTILMGDADDQDVRQALVFSLDNDKNADVRLKALEGLKRYGNDPEVQNALARVLLSDSNTGIRTQAIDALTARQGVLLNRQIVGTLQELMARENDAYVREQTQRILQSLKASSEIY